MTEVAKAFKLYGNLLSNEARQPWEKIVKAQTTKCPWEDICGVTHDKKYKKTNYFKLTLPHMGSDLKVTLLASGTP
jgi:hypothetical protein